MLQRLLALLAWHKLPRVSCQPLDQLRLSSKGQASRTEKEEVVKERARVLVQVKLQVRRSANTSLLAVAANAFLTFQPSLDRPAQTESFGLSRAGFMHKLLHFRNFSRISDAYPYKCGAEVQAPFPMLWHKPAMKICRHKPICRCGH